MATYDWLIDNAIRDKYPAEFALTAAEAKLIVRAEWVFTDAVHKYIGLEDEELYSEAVQSAMEADVFDAFKEKHISPKRIIQIGERVRSGDYWSYNLVHVVVPNQEQGIERIDTYTLESNIEGLGGKEFDTSSLEAFFATDNPRERARFLGVPDTALYVPPFELSSLKHLWKICKERQLTPQVKPDYWRIKSSPVLDVLSEIGSTALIERELIDGFTDTYKITAANGVTVSITAVDYDDVELLFRTPNADKLLTQFNRKAVEQGLNSKTVQLTLDEVMEERGLKDRKEAAKALRAATKFLFALNVGIEDKETGSFKLRKIAQAADYEAGTGRKAYATITYSDAYFKELQTTQQFLQYPRKLQLIPNKKQNAYIFGKAFALQKRRNIGKPDDIEDKLSVATLLRRSILPRQQDLKDKGQASQLIIKPFIDALDYLEQELQLFSYQFQYKKSGSYPVELTEVDIDRLYGDYSLFYTLIVKVTWNDAADYQNLLERKQAQRSKARQSQGKGRGKGKPAKG